MLRSHRTVTKVVLKLITEILSLCFQLYRTVTKVVLKRSFWSGNFSPSINRTVTKVVLKRIEMIQIYVPADIEQ